MTVGKEKRACLDGSSCLERSDKLGSILLKTMIMLGDSGGLVRESDVTIPGGS